MPNYKILITDGLDASAQTVLSAHSVDDRTNISAEDLAKIIADYDALIVARAEVRFGVGADCLCGGGVMCSRFAV